MIEYDRGAAVAYAHAWAYGRNPAYAIFDEMGGDCANFVSQCLFAGGGQMNYAANGWYYRSLRDRSPAWSGVYFLHQFLRTNQGAGPYGNDVPLDAAQPGDMFQMSFVDGLFTHSGLVVEVRSPTPSGILIAAHTIDSDYRPLDSYVYQSVRITAISGVRGNP